jgi:hypothetical protein
MTRQKEFPEIRLNSSKSGKHYSSIKARQLRMATRKSNSKLDKT